MLDSRLSKTCDDCKSRKVRCSELCNNAASGSRKPNLLACTNCVRRRTPCHFSQNKRRTKIVDDGSESFHQDAALPLAKSAGIADVSSSAGPRGDNHIDQTSQTPVQDGEIEMSDDDLAQPFTVGTSHSHSTSRRVYMDEMLEGKGVHGKEFHGCLIPRTEKQNVSSSSLSLFSDSDIRSISEKLSNPRFGDLIESFSDSINKRLHRKANDSYPRVIFNRHWQPVQLPAAERARYVQVFFDQVHPVFPFLVKDDFEKQVINHSTDESIERDTPFFVLYCAVQAIGSQYSGNGAFDPGIGPSWQLFQACLDRLHELIGSRPCLASAQALLAMFCYAMTPCGGPVAETLLSEAARMAQFIRLNRGSPTLTDGAHQRTFWVIYSLEKLSSFCQGRSSAIPDEDVGCHIPQVPEAIFDDFDWFLTSVRFGRLLSQAQSGLFSITASMRSREDQQQALQVITNDLDAWRLGIPAQFRPGEHFARSKFRHPTAVMAVLRLHLSYHNLIMVLCRLSIQIVSPDVRPNSVRLPIIENYMSSARCVLELTAHLEVEPYSPSVLLTVYPLSAFLSLFHLIIDNPHHPQTQDNLTILGVAAGYFRRLEYIMKQEFPFSVFPKLAAVAQEFIIQVSIPPQPQQTRDRHLDPQQPVSEGQEALSRLRYDQLSGNNQLSDASTIVVAGSAMAEDDRMVLPQEQSTHGYPQYGGGNAISASLDQLPPVVEDPLYQLDGAQLDQENEVMDFFGNLLDETYDSLYGSQVDWQTIPLLR